MYYNNGYPNYQDDRFFFFPFLGPLLLGGIGGAAIAGAARPRPVYVNAPMAPAPYPVPYGPRPYPYGYNQYSGYNYY